ncbi:hypothetical protein DCO44_15890 [Acinetobacter sp. AM]|nr:hypothetical protein DCO44_15890 [Acinetobacter sp. AM]
MKINQISKIKKLTIFYSCQSVQHFSMVKNIYKGSFLFLKPLVKKLYKLFKFSDDLAAVLTILLIKRAIRILRFSVSTT